jgi:hypothetical protein
MKKFILLSFIALYVSLSGAVAQNPVVNPIPSFNFPMNEPTAVFHETKINTNSGKEKRDMDVVVNTRSTYNLPVFAIVFVFRLNPIRILGPYIIFPDAQLTVPIDQGKWGVLVKCNAPVDVSVWVD